MITLILLFSSLFANEPAPSHFSSSSTPQSSLLSAPLADPMFFRNDLEITEEPENQRIPEKKSVDQPDHSAFKAQTLGEQLTAARAWVTEKVRSFWAYLHSQPKKKAKTHTRKRSLKRPRPEKTAAPVIREPDFVDHSVSYMSDWYKKAAAFTTDIWQKYGWGN